MDDIIITTEEQNDDALAELEELTLNEKPTDREQGYIDRLTAAIEKFEAEHYPIAEPSPRTKQLIADALGDDSEKARKAMTELNWFDAEDYDG
jgi:antitoxin component HigA of HigAB toxin-antitoxin module